MEEPDDPVRLPLKPPWWAKADVPETARLADLLARFPHASLRARLPFDPHR